MLRFHDESPQCVLTTSWSFSLTLEMNLDYWPSIPGAPSPLTENPMEVGFPEICLLHLKYSCCCCTTIHRVTDQSFSFYAIAWHKKNVFQYPKTLRDVSRLVTLGSKNRSISNLVGNLMFGVLREIVVPSLDYIIWHTERFLCHPFGGTRILIEYICQNTSVSQHSLWIIWCAADNTNTWTKCKASLR